MSVFQHWGIELTRAMQALGPAWEGPWRLLTGLGHEEFFRLLIPLLYWCVDTSLGARVALLVLASNQVNGWAKWLFHEPRPCWLAPDLRRELETSYGIPSGHAQNAVTIWFYLAWLSRRRWAWPLAGAVVLLVSLSRIYLGVHFPHDIVIGWALGLACLWAFLRWGDRLEAWLVGRPLPALLIFSAALAAGLIGVSAAVLFSIGGVVDPPAWAPDAAHARDLAGAFGMAGMLSGAVLGYGLQELTLRFDAGGPPGKRILRFAVGSAGLAGILFGMAAVFHPDPESAAAGAWRFARYFAAMLWATWGAPLLFVAAGLAARRPVKV